MRVATPDPLVSAIGDRAAASKLGRAAVTHSRPPITFHPGASMRRRPRRSSNRSESRPNQVMQALSERYRPLIGDRCRRDAVAWAPSSRGGRRRIGPRSRIASGKSKSAISGDRRQSRQLAARRRRSAADVWSAGLMPKSNLKKKFLSAPLYDRRSGSLPARRHGEPADASCHARSASIGDRRSSGGEQAWPGCSNAQPAADHISPRGFDASATASLF